jgi:hypothetical protein|tara:strand:+ start:96 stop:356 length:261 start_codon:yes stop_codon:yes gene_type:complete
MKSASNSSQPEAKAARSKALEWVCENVIPNCDKAIALVEKGIEEPLTSGNKLSLKYHKRLCPFCGCNEGKFTSLLERYKAVDAERG